MNQHPISSEPEGAAPAPLLKEQLIRVIRLSVPAILAQISSMAMQYIDAAMVGSLGANASAAIGLVSTSTWLLGGLCISLATGFSVQVAQLIGGGREGEARGVLRQALVCALAMGLLLAAVGMSISARLPVWLGATPPSGRTPPATSSSTPPPSPPSSCGSWRAACSSAAAT